MGKKTAKSNGSPKSGHARSHATAKLMGEAKVRSASYHVGSKYCARTDCNRGAYTKQDIDFLVAYLPPQAVFYIIPVEALGGRARIYLNPTGCGRGMFEKYREAWCLLDCTPEARGWKDIPVLCRCEELPVRCAVCPLLE